MTSRFSRTVACVLLCTLVSGRNSPLGRLPPLGWNTWCTWSSCHQDNKSLTHAFHDVCTEEMVKDVAQAMIDQGLQKAGYYMVNLDDCWEATTRDPATGAMRADPARFPSGTLKELADWLHARNFSFGMYTAAGNETCSTGGRTIPGKNGSRGVDGSFGHYEQDAKTYAEWGVDYVKLDWCTGYTNKSELTTKFRQALDASGRDMWLNFHCDGPYQAWCAEDGNSWRIGTDHHDVWSNTKDVIQVLATVNLHNQTGPHRWADPDFLMTGGAGCDINQTAVRCPGQTENEYRTEMSLWTIGAAQILVATDLREMTPFMKEILLHDEILAIHQDALARPGGRIGYSSCGGNSSARVVGGSAEHRYPKCEVWARELADSSMAVGLYNGDSVAHDITADISTVWKGFGAYYRREAGPAGDTAVVRDVWQRKDLGTFTGKFTASAVGVHDTRVLRFSRT